MQIKVSQRKARNVFCKIFSRLTPEAPTKKIVRSLATQLEAELNWRSKLDGVLGQDRPFHSRRPVEIRMKCALKALSEYYGK